LKFVYGLRISSILNQNEKEWKNYTKKKYVKDVFSAAVGWNVWIQMRSCYAVQTGLELLGLIIYQLNPISYHYIRIFCKLAALLSTSSISAALRKGNDEFPKYNLNLCISLFSSTSFCFIHFPLISFKNKTKISKQYS
jgi:hypothetical protein